MSRRVDSMSVLGLALAAVCVLAFVDWLVFARGLPVPRGTHSMLDLGSWLARRGDSAGLTQALRLALAAGGIASSALAALIFLRATENVAARQIAWALLGYAAFTFSAHFLAVDARYSAGQPLRYASHALSTALFTFVALAVARFLMIFPRPVDFDSIARHPWFGRSRTQAAGGTPTLAHWMGSLRARSAIMATCHRMLLDGRMLLIAPVAMFALVAGDRALQRTFPSDVWGAIAVIFFIAWLLLFAGGICPMAMASTRHLYRNGTEVERRRVAWLRAVLLAAAAAVALLILVPLLVRKLGGSGALTDAWAGVLFLAWIALPTLFIGGLAFAVLYGGALDPRVAFTRVTLWTVLGLAITGAFLVLERFVALKAVEWLALPKETGLVVAGGVIAATFVPLRHGVERALMRLADRYLPISIVADGARVVKTVAITDLSGYTALTQRDEPLALIQGALLKRQAERIAGALGGRVVKSMGDAVMLTFDSPRDAALAVERLHAAYGEAAAALDIEPLPLHTALHAGEIVESHDGDIYGHTVNLCARLVDAAAPGEIVASAAVAAVLLPDGRAIACGERRFKNVSEAVSCYRVLPMTSPAPVAAAARAHASEPQP